MNKKVKTSLILFLCLLFVVILLQNTEVVSFKILFWTFSMSRIILFSLVLFAGIMIGVAGVTWKDRRNHN